MGPSGSGKSTVTRLYTPLLHASPNPDPEPSQVTRLLTRLFEAGIGSVRSSRGTGLAWG